MTVLSRSVDSRPHQTDATPLPRSRSLLQWASLAYVASIPLNETPIIPGRSVSAAVGLIVLGLWVLSFGRRASEETKGPPAPAVLYALMSAFVLLALLRMPASVTPDTTFEGLARLVPIMLLVPALAKGLRDCGTAPISVYIAAASALGVLLIIDVAGADVTQIYRASSLELNENEAALMAALGAVFAVIMLARTGPIRRFWYGLALLLCTAGGFATGSKTGLLAILSACAFAALALAVSDNRTRGSLLLFVVVFGVFAVSYLSRDYFPHRLQDTINSLGQWDLDSRETIWETAIGYRDVWLPWGTGFQTTFTTLSDYYGLYRVAHNTVLEAGIDLGYPGMLLVVATFVAIGVTARHSPYHKFVWAGLIPLTLFAMSTSLWHFKILWFVAALAAVRERRAAPPPEGGVHRGPGLPEPVAQPSEHPHSLLNGIDNNAPAQHHTDAPLPGECRDY